MSDSGEVSTWEKATRLGWPSECPVDLRAPAEQLLRQRGAAPVDLWAVVREWLARHDLEAPETVGIELPWTERTRPDGTLL